MEFIRNEKERINEFYKLWNEEIDINPKFHKLVYGNDIFFYKGISKEDIMKVLTFCTKYHKKFKYPLSNYEYSVSKDEKLADEIYSSLENGEMFLLKHLFDYD